VRVFLDTNVLISAFATRGVCADLMRLLMAEHDVLAGEVNLVELRRVLTKRFNHWAYWHHVHRDFSRLGRSAVSTR
jgi:predicted nucleic acid-binding protein